MPRSTSTSSTCASATTCCGELEGDLAAVEVEFGLESPDAESTEFEASSRRVAELESAEASEDDEQLAV